MDDKLTRAAEDPLIKQDENLQLEQDVIVPLAASRKVYVFETTDFWRQMKTAAYVPSSLVFGVELMKQLRCNSLIPLLISISPHSPIPTLSIKPINNPTMLHRSISHYRPNRQNRSKCRNRSIRNHWRRSQGQRRNHHGRIHIRETLLCHQFHCWK